MTQKQLDARDWKAVLRARARARTNADGTPKTGYKRNVEAIRKAMALPNGYGDTAESIRRMSPYPRG